MIAYAQTSKHSALFVFNVGQSFFSAHIWSTQETPFIPGPKVRREITRDEVEGMIAEYIATDDMRGQDGDQFDVHLHSTQDAAMRDHAARLILSSNH